VERCYETIFILRPTLNDQEITEAIDNYKDLLVRHGAVMFKQEDLGKKKLAYLIQKFQNGHYALYQYKAEAPAVSELERSFKISEDVLRYLTVKLDKNYVPPPAEESVDTPEADSSTPEADSSTPEADSSTPEADSSTPEADSDTPEADSDTPKEEEA
jgi:small subunit ribosomal protein S6